MKKTLAVLFSLALLIGFSVSTASAGVYISGNLGAVFLDDSDFDVDDISGEFSFDTGGVATFAVGTSIGAAVRIELELASRVNDSDQIDYDDFDFSLEVDGEVTTGSFMANAYYDFKNEGRFTPFIGGGLGFANVEYDIDDIGGLDDTDGKEDDDVMAYQMMLGVGFAATEKLSIDLQYRYFGTEDPEFDGIDVEYQTHNILLGLRYSF